MMMQVEKYSHGAGVSCCRIDNDGPASDITPITSPQRFRLTPRLSRFAPVTFPTQIRHCVGGNRHGD